MIPARGLGPNVVSMRAYQVQREIANVERWAAARSGQDRLRLSGFGEASVASAATSGALVAGGGLVTTLMAAPVIGFFAALGYAFVKGERTNETTAWWVFGGTTAAVLAVGGAASVVGGGVVAASARG